MFPSRSSVRILAQTARQIYGRPIRRARIRESWRPLSHRRAHFLKRVKHSESFRVALASGQFVFVRWPERAARITRSKVEESRTLVEDFVEKNLRDFSYRNEIYCYTMWNLCRVLWKNQTETFLLLDSLTHSSRALKRDRDFFVFSFPFSLSTF